MRTKKLFSLLLAVLMLCSLSVSAFAAETAQDSVPVEYDGLRYTVYANRVSDHSDAATVLYYIDDTQLKKQAEEYQSSRPAVLLVAMDSLDEIAHGLRLSLIHI